jgi:predicted nucleic acid-binding protein
VTVDRVVDACAMAAFVFDEPDRPLVEARLSDSALFVPMLFRFEMASVCLKKIRARPDEKHLLLAAYERSLLIPLTELDVALTEVIELAIATRLTLYDASYLWLSRHLGIELITIDANFLKAAARLP